MAVMQGGARFARIAEKWHALAQRRLAYIRELERSGRWKRYYTDEQYALCLREAERTAMLWSKLASQQSAPAGTKKDLRPAA
jgi:uncharacterized repeat protein (TIGR03809 family)